jgi:cytochrome c oxidase subunit 1
LSLPLLWLGGMIAVGLIGAAEIPGPGADYSLHDTDYVIAHVHYTLSVAAAFAVFAFAYWLMDRLMSRGYSRALGVLHFAATLAGMVLIAVPILAVRAFDLSRARPVETFQALSRVSSVGYLLSLVGTAIFAGVLIDAVRRRLTKGRSVA